MMTTSPVSHGGPSSGVPATPSSTKSKARAILDKLSSNVLSESNPEDLFELQQLYQLSLFSKNRRILMNDLDILARLASHLDLEYCVRVLQLYAQDGDEPIAVLRAANVPRRTVDMLNADGASRNLKMALIGLVYWLAQDKDAKQMLVDAQAEDTIRAIQASVAANSSGASGHAAGEVAEEYGSMFSKFVEYALNSLAPQTKSRSELRTMLQRGEIPEYPAAPAAATATASKETGQSPSQPATTGGSAGVGEKAGAVGNGGVDAVHATPATTHTNLEDFKTPNSTPARSEQDAERAENGRRIEFEDDVRAMSPEATEDEGRQTSAAVEDDSAADPADVDEEEQAKQPSSGSANKSAKKKKKGKKN
eukprot:ANDGO_02799.mRNA.1 hypothetical protein